jgi:hypothetical protein
MLITQLPNLIKEHFTETKTKNIKDLIDQRVKDLDNTHLPNEMRFPNGLFDVNFTDMKSIAALIHQLPFVLCGVFNDQGKTFILIVVLSFIS